MDSKEKNDKKTKNNVVDKKDFFKYIKNQNIDEDLENLEKSMEERYQTF